MVVTDSIAATNEVAKCPKVRRISIAPLIGEAMRRINNEESVSSLFD
jgi:ribose-phosphate pyrophosphokinase